jgi:TolB-like protein/DNA-binding winged helix-turn-helix (wHTH) protein/Tfp pilus assembly protein PilF
MCFGPFEVDSVSGELRKHGVQVKLQDQPLQILLFLLEHPGDVVTREELRQRLWPADTFVDFDHGLYNAVKRLREALGDDAETPQFIETVPKRGYRFIGEITGDRRPAAEGDSSAVAVPAELSSPALPWTAFRWPKKRLLVLVGASGLALILLLLYGLKLGAHVRTARIKPPQIHALAVLPLKNLSDDPAQEYFSYGMTEELITDLAQISGLKVISHTSVLQFAKSTKPLTQIASELGVDGVDEGTVQRSGNRVRITAQLIYAPQEQHLWAQTYDRDLQDTLSLQTSVAAAIVESIRPKTAAYAASPRKPRASPSLQAEDDYLHGKYSMHRMASGAGREGWEAALKYFQKAVSEDPDFAEPYVALAGVYDTDYAVPQTDMGPLEKAALMKALELDPGSAEAHLQMATLIYGECDRAGQERELKQALGLNPNLAEAHHLYSRYLHEMGREPESLREEKSAEELDPEGMYGVDTFVKQGQYDRAIEKLNQYLELHPNDGSVYHGSSRDLVGLIDLYHFAGRYREEIDAIQKAWTLFGFKGIGRGVGKAYAASGYAGALRYSARQLEYLYAQGAVDEPDMIASWYARAGDEAQARKWKAIRDAHMRCPPSGEENHDDRIATP